MRMENVQKDGCGVLLQLNLSNNREIDMHFIIKVCINVHLSAYSCYSYEERKQSNPDNCTWKRFQGI